MSRIGGFQGRIPDRRSLESKVKEAITERLQTKINSIVRTVERRVSGLIVKHLRRSEVVKALIGTGGIDLQAELGLTQDEAAVGMAAMVDIIKENIKVEYKFNKSNTRSLIIDISIEVYGYAEEIEEMDEGSYISTNGYEIRWSYVMINPSSNFIINNYGILYNDGRGGSRDLFANSKSGRAIMIPSNYLSYEFPELLIRPGAENFIDEILTSDEFQEEVAEVAAKALTEALNRFS